ncbi:MULTISPECIES: response regulator [Sphingobacterium]|uniref:response regulator n=1 Tax=Sphingobacterium TaxID=28453 RepID=UPI000A07D4A7|nr:response regulator [Sphingobacterium sp. Ag1]
MMLKMLIVDDNKLNHFILEFHLREIGLFSSLISLYSGSELIEKLEELCPIDGKILIFLDINMPTMNGWQVLDFIDQFHLKTNISIIILTSESSPQTQERAFTYPNVINFIEKPINRDKILSILP